MRFAPFFLVIFSCFTVMAMAEDGFPPGFDGYAIVQGPAKGAPTYQMLLSQSLCPDKGAPKQWKKGAYRFRTGLEPTCWTVIGDDVRMCPRGQYETKYKPTDYGSMTVVPCHEWPFARFYRIPR